MKKLRVTIIAGVLLVLAAPVAVAQNYLSLAWGDCLVDGGLATINPTCGATSWTEYLIFTHQLGVNQPQFVGIEGVIDMQDDTNASAMGDWWQWDVGGVGTCRTGAISQGQAEASTSPGFTGTTCIDLGLAAATTPTLGGLIRRPSPGLATPNTQRIQFQWVVPANQPVPYTAGTQVAAGNLRVRSLAATGHSTCTGCTNAITLTLNSIFCGQPAGAPNGNVTAVEPLPFPGPTGFFTNCVQANQSTAMCLTGATPTQTRTWGQIKSLYR